MQYEAKLTLDGLMTLIAGLIAFVAVMIQIRSSSKQLRDQLKDQRNAEREETERQKRAIATAMLAEIDETYRYMLRDVHEFLRSIDPYKEDLQNILVKSFVARFPILDANAGKIGDLGEETVANVVGFYSCIRAYLISLDNFAARSVSEIGNLRRRINNLRTAIDL